MLMQADPSLTRSRRLDRRAGLQAYEIEDREDPGVTSFAGLPLAIEAYAALGLDEVARDHVRAKTRNRGVADAEWARLFVILHFAGGEHVSDLDALLKDAGLRRMWPLLDKINERRAYDFLYRFEDGLEATPGKAVIRPECPALQGLGRMRDHLVDRVQRLHPVKVATLDADASIHEANKREALWTYDKVRGYQPYIITWAEQNLIVRDQFRDGNVGAGYATLPEIQAAFASLPSGVEKRLFRSDSACYEHKIMRWLDREGIEFGISADMSSQLRAACRELPDEAWKPLTKRDKRGRVIETDRQWAEVVFVPDDPTAKEGDRPYRYIAIRRPQQRDLFDPSVEAWTYHAIVSNRKSEGDGDAIILWQRQRCGTVEASHSVLKNDTGARVLPSKSFGANAAWYRFAVIAANLKVAIGLALPEEWRALRLSTWRFRLVRLAGRVVDHARRLRLILGRGCTEVAKLLRDARRFLRERVATLSASP